MHILSPETDNCPSWISWKERMTVGNISWSISMKECCWPRWGLNPRPPVSSRTCIQLSHRGRHHSKVVPLLQCSLYINGFICGIRLFVLHLFSFWCIGKAVLWDCGISWVSSFIVWHFMWIICYADNSHKISRLNLLEKKNKKTSSAVVLINTRVNQLKVKERICSPRVRESKWSEYNV